MTLDEIKASDKVMLNAADVAEVLHTDAHSIRLAAHDDPGRLGFPTIVCGRGGRRVKIPRIPFLDAIGQK